MACSATKLPSSLHEGARMPIMSAVCTHCGRRSLLGSACAQCHDQQTLPACTSVGARSRVSGNVSVDAARFQRLGTHCRVLQLRDGMARRRILIAVDGMAHNVLKIKPPMCFSLQDADCLLQGLLEVRLVLLLLCLSTWCCHLAVLELAGRSRRHCYSLAACVCVQARQLALPAQASLLCAGVAGGGGREWQAS